jgi:hypothetical protein
MWVRIKPRLRTLGQPRWLERWTALTLLVAAALVVLTASRSQGLARDEAYYMRAGELYVTYWEKALLRIASGGIAAAFADPFIETYFAYNAEHPALMKTLGGISWRLLHRCTCPEQAGRLAARQARHPTLGWLDGITAFRLPAALLFGALVAFVYLFALRLAGGLAGFVAAGLTLGCPPIFFHAQLLCFDAPVAAFWVGTVYFYQRSLFDPRAAKWAGLLFGLGFATKFNLGFLPMVLVPHWAFLWARERRRPPVRAFVHMAIQGTAIFLLHWPHLWHQPVERLTRYVTFHLEHWHYNFEFLGVNYNNPPYPIYFSVVSTLLVAPVVMLGLAGIGFSAPPAQRPGAPRLLIGLGAAVPLVILMLPGAPIFGGVKHFLATLPMLAVAAGSGAALIHGASAGLLPSAASATLIGVLAVTPAVLETQRSHPYGLSFYNALAGGFRGGAALGMNRQFWATAARAVLPFLNQLPEGTRVYLHDINHDAYRIYVREGMLSAGVLDSGMEEAGIRASSVAIVIHERHFNRYEFMIWEAYGTTRPVRVIAAEGVPLITIYQRPEPSGRP